MMVNRTYVRVPLSPGGSGIAMCNEVSRSFYPKELPWARRK